MIIITTSDFRANQTKFLDMANKGEDIVLKSRTSGSFRIMPIAKEETIAKENDLMKDLRGALLEVKEYREGKRNFKSLDDLINEL